MGDSFNTEEFIKEIESFPAIWNPECLDYCDRNLRTAAWVSIVNKFGGEELDNVTEKNAFGRKLQKKWKNIRDCFFRELRRQKATNASGPSDRVPYVHFNQLLFLKNVADSSSTQNINSGGNFEENVDSNDEQTNNVRKAETDEDQSTLDVMKTVLRIKEAAAKSKKDQDKMFLLSLTDDLKRVPERNKLLLKADIIRLIHRAQTCDLELHQEPYGPARKRPHI